MTPILATLDPWIFTFSTATVIVTIWMGFWAARRSKTASDFYVAGRAVSVGWNASAISGEYLSAASFMGVAGMVMAVGYDALWYPVCYACGYLFLLLFIAGPLRRFGAYTVPDLAEGRFNSPLFRKIAVVFVLFIGFFYTMPQMKGAGTTLAYIFPGLPYWAGVVLVGTVITLNVALGGMKGITLVQAFQYWAKMFAISVPIFVLMAVYGHYGKQLGVNGNIQHPANTKLDAASRVVWITNVAALGEPAPSTFIANDLRVWADSHRKSLATQIVETVKDAKDKPAVGQTLVNRDLAWTFTAEHVPELLFKWYWIRCVSQQHTPDVLVYSSDLLNTIITPEAHSIFTNSTAADFLERQFKANQLTFRAVEPGMLLVHSAVAESYSTSALDEFKRMTSVRKPLPEKAPADSTWLSPFGPLTTRAATAAGITGEAAKPFSLLYTYSLIIALVCGTAGLPHILVRFYTNPDGGAAKRTTMWVMILIGIFYVFPPVFGVMGRNLLPELYAATGAKGTDKIVLELPRLLNDKYAPLGSILSGITCAGAFAAFMSTFSGLLVSMTGAMAHDVYGRMLNPKATAEQRLRAFKCAAVGVGGVAIILGTFVEPLQINFMVGQAFAIAAASYFPLLFMCAWWRNLTMKGAATGMLTGGLLAVASISITSFSDLARATDRTAEIFAVFKPMNDFWAAHPLLRILCEQPAIWAVPLAIGLMLLVSKLTRRDVPKDIRMKMLVLHAPEKLGIKQEYIREQQPGH